MAEVETERCSRCWGVQRQHLPKHARGMALEVWHAFRCVAALLPVSPENRTQALRHLAGTGITGPAQMGDWEIGAVPGLDEVALGQLLACRALQLQQLLVSLTQARASMQQHAHGSCALLQSRTLQRHLGRHSRGCREPFQSLGAKEAPLRCTLLCSHTLIPSISVLYPRSSSSTLTRGGLMHRRPPLEGRPLK